MPPESRSSQAPKKYETEHRIRDIDEPKNDVTQELVSNKEEDVEDAIKDVVAYNPD